MSAMLKIGDFVEAVDPSRHGSLEVAVPQRWYLLRVHPSREASVMRTFARRNISAYLPTITKSAVVTRYRIGYSVDVKRNVTMPLFPGLILVPDFEYNQDRLRSIDGVVGFLRFGPCTAFLNQKLIADVRNIEAIGNVPPSKRERMYALGQLVRVVDGPFASFAGRIERLDSNGRLSVLVDLFKRMVPVGLDQDQIAPA